MAPGAVAFFAGEIVHALTATNRASLTMLPLVIGLLLTAFILAWALVRLVAGRFTAKGSAGLSHCLYVANCYSSGDWQLKQPTAVALPAIILKVGCLGCWSAGFLIRRVAG